jgi:hypothetical protein
MGTQTHNVLRMDTFNPSVAATGDKPVAPRNAECFRVFLRIKNN